MSNLQHFDDVAIKLFPQRRLMPSFTLSTLSAGVFRSYPLRSERQNSATIWLSGTREAVFQLMSWLLRLGVARLYAKLKTTIKRGQTRLLINKGY